MLSHGGGKEQVKREIKIDFFIAVSSTKRILEGPNLMFWGKGNIAGISVSTFLCFLKILVWVEKIIREIKYLPGLKRPL